MSVERRIVTPRQTREQLADATRLAPGVWVDRENGLHFSVPELLAVMNVRDTPENRDVLLIIIRDHLAALYPDATVVEQIEES
jgi:hypothetical protein